jgi:hypothetical protein
MESLKNAAHVAASSTPIIGLPLYQRCVWNSRRLGLNWSYSTCKFSVCKVGDATGCCVSLEEVVDKILVEERNCASKTERDHNRRDLIYLPESSHPKLNVIFNALI